MRPSSYGVLASALVAALVGCAVPGPASSSPPTPSTPASPDATASSAAPSGSPEPTPTTLLCAAKLVDAMTPAEQAGQLVMVGITNASQRELGVLRRFKIGSVILTGQRRDGVRGVRALTDRLDAVALPTPVLIAADQEGGLVQRLSGRGFDTIPSARVQGGWSDPKLTGAAARWGRQLVAAGVDWTLAPVADTVPRAMTSSNAPIGALARGYGSDPKVVAAKVRAFVAGMSTAGIVTSAKHFPGIGRVRGNTDFTAGVQDRVTGADDPYLEPFRAAVRAGVASIMVSSVTYTRIDPKRTATFSPAVLGLIRSGLGFAGVVISDDLGAARALASVPASQRGIRFLRAGGDVAMTVSPALAEAFVGGIRRAAREPTVAARIRASAVRVLTLKVQLGLLRCR